MFPSLFTGSVPFVSASISACLCLVRARPICACYLRYLWNSLVLSPFRFTFHRSDHLLQAQGHGCLYSVFGGMDVHSKTFLLCTR